MRCLKAIQANNPLNRELREPSGCLGPMSDFRRRSACKVVDRRNGLITHARHLAALTGSQPGESLAAQIRALRINADRFPYWPSALNSWVPTFSSECGVSGAPQTAAPKRGVEFDARVSASAISSGSRRTKSLAARI